MQTILGSGGPIGTELAKALRNYTTVIRLVSRNPRKVNPEDELMAGDLLDYAVVDEAVKGSEVVYLTIGFPYSYKYWKKYWPKLVADVIKACKENQAKLVFFDNVYMYGKVDGWMTEETLSNPCSKKGEVRAQIAELLLEEIKKENIQGLIARSADFYGPRAHNTYTNAMVFERIKDGKKPQVLINPMARHSYTYTPDAARAMVLLGNTEEAYGQVWHLPTDSDVLTGEEFLYHANQVTGKENRYSVMTPFMINMASLFSPVIKETKEMLYQFKNDYLFSSSKFDEKFFKATSYKKGIKATMET